MTSCKAEDIKNRLLECCTLMAFVYNGLDCDIDPFSPSHFHLSCAGTERDFESIDAVMNEPFFDGACLKDIAEEIEITEW